MTWLFKDSPDLAVITTRQVLESNYPILRVTHETKGGNFYVVRQMNRAMREWLL